MLIMYLRHHHREDMKSIRSQRRHRPDGPGRVRGFTLLEILVALAIFGVVSITVYGRIGDVLMQTGSLEARTFATWIAQNTLTRLQIERPDGEGPSNGRTVETFAMAGREWEVVTEVSASGERGLHRVEIRVSVPEGGGRATEEASVARLTGFLGQH